MITEVYEGEDLRFIALTNDNGQLEIRDFVMEGDPPATRHLGDPEDDETAQFIRGGIDPRALERAVWMRPRAGSHALSLRGLAFAGGDVLLPASARDALALAVAALAHRARAAGLKILPVNGGVLMWPPVDDEDAAVPEIEADEDMWETWRWPPTWSILRA